jgi:hypothetical protein
MGGTLAGSARGALGLIWAVAYLMTGSLFILRTRDRGVGSRPAGTYPNITHHSSPCCNPRH